MTLALADVDVAGSPAWWMQKLAREMLDRERLRWFAILDAYRSGCPPLVTATDSQQKAFHAFNRVSRSNFARPIVRAPAERMAVRAIRTAAANDDQGDAVAWRYWTGLGLDVAAMDVHSDMLTFRESYVRVGVDGATGKPVAVRLDPRFTITYQNPLNPMETLAALELVWDELTGTDYAVLSLPGEQWVASRERKMRPTTFSVPGITAEDRRRAGMSWFPRLSFDASSFTMRPFIDEVPEAERDGGLYSQRFGEKVVSIVKFLNREGVGEFEEHLDTLDRLFFLTMLMMVTAGVQAYKQRALQQDDNATAGDRLPDRNPETGERIDWDEVFQPGPDALWKLPPGVKIWESGEVQLQPLLSARLDTIKELSQATSTPFQALSDSVNQSAEGVQATREGLVFKVEDRCTIAARSWSQVISLLFRFAPDEDRYDADGNDRADAGKIVLDWKPAERYSLAEKSQADSQNKSLSADMAAMKIWGLTADEVEINRAQRHADLFAAASVNPQQAAANANPNAG